MKNRILIYDDHCPLCVCYTKAFVKTGLLKDEQRKAFSTLPDSLMLKMDFEKGKNEIPLVDTVSGNVLYGIDALLEILGRKFPLIKSIGNFAPVKWFLVRLYKFISYNRKVIVAKKCGSGDIDCSPGFSYCYRILFMCVFFIFNTLMLFPFHKVLTMLPYYHLSVTELQFSHLGLVAANCFSAMTFSREKAIDYLGQVNMLALICILLLTPLILLNNLLTPGMITVYLILLTVFIFHEYLRRMEYVNMLRQRKWIVSFNLSALSLFLLYIFS